MLSNETKLHAASGGRHVSLPAQTRRAADESRRTADRDVIPANDG